MSVDANGRFIDQAAYSSETLGRSICSILGEQKLPVGLVLDTIKLQLDMEPSKGCKSDELRASLITFGNELSAIFTDGHATDDEVKEGFIFALGLVEAFDSLENQLGDENEDSKTLH